MSKQKQNYWEKLKDPRWQRKRLEVMKRSFFSCEKCYREDQTLNVHHLYYMSKRDPWEYPDFALISVCEECHAEEHEIQFSQFEEIIECLVGNEFFNPYIVEIVNQIHMARNHNPETCAFLYDCMDAVTKLRIKYQNLTEETNEDQNN